MEKLKADPKNPDLLIIGNLYYDAQQYLVAMDYYGRALKNKPADAAVRTEWQRRIGIGRRRQGDCGIRQGAHL